MRIPQPSACCCSESRSWTCQFLLGHHSCAVGLSGLYGFLCIFKCLVVLLVPHVCLCLQTIDNSKTWSSTVFTLVVCFCKDFLCCIKVREDEFHHLVVCGTRIVCSFLFRSLFCDDRYCKSENLWAVCILVCHRLEQYSEHVIVVCTVGVCHSCIVFVFIRWFGHWFESLNGIVGTLYKHI